MCLFVILVFAATAIAFPFIGIIASRGHGQVAEDRVQVDAMGIDALFQSFKMGDGTTQTTHAVFFKYFYGIGPFFYDFTDTHIFVNQRNYLLIL